MSQIVVKIESGYSSLLGNTPDSIRKKIDRARAGALREIAAMAHTTWISIAQRSLNTSLIDYVNGLQKPGSLSIGEDQAVITLVGWLANAIEQGLSAFDMKQGMLRSAKVKYDEKGRPYIDIPFRHMTPGTTGAFGKPMPRAIYQEARKLDPTSAMSIHPMGGGPKRTVTIKWGGRITRDFAENIAPPITQSRAGMNVNVPLASGKTGTKQLTSNYTHATSLYSGMFRNTGTGRGGSTYFTIRRISLNSADSSWIHPGFRARRFSDQVRQKIQSDAPAIMQRHLQRQGLGR